MMKKWFCKITAPSIPESEEAALLQELRELQKITFNNKLGFHTVIFGEVYGLRIDCEENHYSEEQWLDKLQAAINIKRKEISVNKRMKEIKAELGIQ
jgi:hypothetical protein